MELYYPESIKSPGKIVNIFLARQPIFDNQYQVVAYELLFRDGVENLFSATDPHRATSLVMADSFLHFDIEKITDGKKAFINLTVESLLEDSIFLLPSSKYSVELTEEIPADHRVIEACRRLKEKGYTIILDDFAFEDDRLPLLEMADMVKIDIMHTKKSNSSSISNVTATKAYFLWRRKWKPPRISSPPVNWATIISRDFSSANRS